MILWNNFTIFQAPTDPQNNIRYTGVLTEVVWDVLPLSGNTFSKNQLRILRDFGLVKNLYAKIEFCTTPFLHIQIRFLHTVLHILDKPIGVAYIITWFFNVCFYHLLLLFSTVYHQYVKICKKYAKICKIFTYNYNIASQ